MKGLHPHSWFGSAPGSVLQRAKGGYLQLMQASGRLVDSTCTTLVFSTLEHIMLLGSCEQPSAS